MLLMAAKRDIIDLMVGSSVVSVSECGGGGCFLLDLPFFLRVEGAIRLLLLFLDLEDMIVQLEI